MKRIVIFWFLAIVLVCSCFAQSVNNAQRIIGTWVDNNTGKTWVFNANGTVSGSDEDGDNFEYKFGVAETKLAISDSGDLDIFTISLSSDGRTLILDKSIRSSGSLYLEGIYWFTKK
jgi:membrane-bound inhibitor of C-type lysozyme